MALTEQKFLQSGTGAVNRDVTDKLRESVSVLDFGADPTGVADSYSAIMSAINSVTVGGGFYPSGPAVYFPPGTYKVNTTIQLKKRVTLYGDGSGLPSGEQAILVFPADTKGIIVHRYNTTDSTVESPETTGADGSIIRGLLIQGSGGTDATAHGIWLRARALIEHVQVDNFKGNGINIVATSGGGGAAEGNANSFRVDTVRVTDCGGHGIYTDGADANAGVVIGADCTTNTGWGIYDSSFLGNTYVGCHVDANTGGAYKADSTSARNVFVGCYSEPGQPASSIAPPSIVVGGLQGAGFDAATLAYVSSVLTALAVGPLNINGSTVTNHAAATQALSTGLAQAYQGRSSDGLAAVTFYANNGSTRYGFFGANSSGVYVGSDTGLRTDLYAGGAIRLVVESGGNFRPNTDNAYTLGTASYRWTVVYATTGTINTSDEREKQDIAALDDAEKRVAITLKGSIKKFRWKDAVEKKGDNARIHVGVIAQEVIAAFQAEGLDATRYGIICYDEWSASEEELDDDGNVLTPAREAGNRYGVRYEELLAFIIAAL